MVLLLLTLAAEPAKDDSLDFFKPTGPVLTLRVEVDKENLDRLKKQPRDKREYVHADIRWNDKAVKNVGIHLKGAAGSFREWGDRPALTINTDKFRKNQTFFGMDKWHLNNSVQDDTYLNELITGEIFRAAGVPTGRATHAFVVLNDRKVGLYVLKEGYDPAFLGRYFKNVNGSLYDGNFLNDIYENPLLKSGDGDPKALKALVDAANTKDHKERMQKLDKILDLDKFFAMWAVEVMCCDWDGYTRNKNNYRFYYDNLAGKFTFFAHGKDQMFQNTNDGLITGWTGLLAKKIWSTEEGRKRYIAKVKEVLEKHMKLADLNRKIDDYALRLREPMNQYQKGWGDQYVKNQVQGYKDRVKARVEFLTREVPKLKP